MKLTLVCVAALCAGLLALFLVHVANPVKGDEEGLLSQRGIGGPPHGGPGRGPGEPGRNPGDPGHRPGDPGRWPGDPGHGHGGGVKPAPGAPTIHRGDPPHVPFNPPGRVHGVHEPVFGHHPYPGRWHPRPGFEWCEGYYWYGVLYPVDFFAYGGWSPTEWVFIVGTQQWYSPGVGYVSAPPVLLNEPITVAVQEQVPVLDAFGNQETDAAGNPVFETVLVYYNAYYDPAYGAYGYQDMDGQYVWLNW